MAVEQLTICEWRDRLMNSIDIANPTWPVIEDAIRSLNNQDRNDLYLTPDRNDVETYLAVGGGDGRYLVTGSIRDERFPTIVDARKPPLPKQPLVVGGQEGDYPSNWIVDLEMALQAAKAFCDAGGFCQGANWQDM